MNETDLIQAINEIDDRYLSESEEPYRKSSMMRNPYGLIIFIVAILALAVPVSAYAISYFLHGDNVEHYISGADEVSRKAPAVIKNLVAENEDYRLTLDTLFSDGHNAIIILTSEAKSDSGKEHFANLGVGKFSPSFCIKYVDGSDGPSHHLTGMDVDVPIIVTSYVYESVKEAKNRDDKRSASIVDFRGIDLRKDVRLELFANDDPFSNDRYFYSQDPILAERFPDESAATIINDLDGIEFIVNLAPNVTCNTLYDAEGHQLFLSAFELYSNDPAVIPKHWDITFIKDSGERIRYDMKGHNMNSSSDKERGYFVFGEFIDPNEYAGVEVNGVEYWK